MEYFVYRVNAKSSPMIQGEHPTTTFLYDREGRRKYLSTSERDAFVQVAHTLSDDKRTFCLTLAYTGARISEVLSLSPKQIDRSIQCIVYETLKRRRRGIFRAVPIPVELLCDLNHVGDLRVTRAHPGSDMERLWPWCRTTAWQLVKHCMALAGVTGPHASPKGLRHAFAVSALQAGVPITLIRKWMGHARLSTTAIYADATGEEEREIAARFWTSFKSL